MLNLLPSPDMDFRSINIIYPPAPRHLRSKNMTFLGVGVCLKQDSQIITIYREKKNAHLTYKTKFLEKSNVEE
jgi:hypothetical protein